MVNPTLPLRILLLEKNLECIKHAKTPHHAKWALFFNQFHFQKIVRLKLSLAVMTQYTYPQIQNLSYHSIPFCLPQSIGT